MLTGWHKIEGGWYYFQGGDSGRMLTGWQKFGSSWYFLDRTSGKMATGLFVDNGKRYYCRGGDSGRMVTGWKKVGAYWYYFQGGNAGWARSGWLNVNNAWYYLEPKTHRMKTGLLKWDNSYFYLRSGDDGRMYSGWLEFKEGWRYFTPAPSGRAAKGSYVINGITYEFDVETSLLMSGQTNVMGVSNLTVNQMVNWYNAKGKPYPGDALSKGGAATIADFANLVLEEARVEGVRPDLVFAQIMLETGWLQFGGAVKVEQYNFSGLGAIDSNPSGNSAWFPDVRTGLRAQVQHLKAYATAADVPLVNPCVDPRFDLVKRGCAPVVEWLGQKENPKGYGWATSAGYGQRLVNLMNELKAASAENIQTSSDGVSVGTAAVAASGDAASSDVAGPEGATSVKGSPQGEGTVSVVTPPDAVLSEEGNLWMDATDAIGQPNGEQDGLDVAEETDADSDLTAVDDDGESTGSGQDDGGDRSIKGDEGGESAGSGTGAGTGAGEGTAGEDAVLDGEAPENAGGSGDEADADADADAVDTGEGGTGTEEAVEAGGEEGAEAGVERIPEQSSEQIPEVAREGPGTGEATEELGDSEALQTQAAEEERFKGLVPLAVENGWSSEEGFWYYYENSQRVLNSWRTDSAFWCYLGADGRALVGWATIGDKTYYFDTSARLVRAWRHIDDIWYFFDQHGSDPTTSNLGVKMKEQTDNPFISPLATHSIAASTSNYTAGRSGRIVDKIILHHAAATTVTSVGYHFQNPTVKASAHYGVGPDQIYRFISENNAAWHCGNYEQNLRSVGIETVNSALAPNYPVSKAAIDTLIPLVADIAKRHNLGKIVKYENIFQHKDFAPTFCAGHVWDYIDYIIEQVNIINGYIKGGWYKDGKYWYFYKDDQKVTNAWQNDSKGRCYLDGKGRAVTGWQKIDGGWYYFDSAMHARRGWLKQSGYWYFFDRTTYKMATGWFTDNGATYYCRRGDSGRMITGWHKLEGGWYYFQGGNSGRMVTGWKKLGGSWYFFDRINGKMATGLFVDNGKRYYCRGGDSGRMVTGWQKAGEYWYYFQEGDAGWARSGWLKIGSAWYYLEPKTHRMLVGWRSLAYQGTTSWYYFYGGNSGRMASGTATIGGTVCTFASGGQLISPSKPPSKT
jgi:glucan-binding YG repeat protein